ncbi:hypothetical protein B0H21DRAFT_868209 [Amylocystis lapponica]|nr:hypothetical protein B0H21DRAFT_868209 [Amylocystis lapponica]
MSFSFKWPRFSDQFHADAIQMLGAALNKGNSPPIIADKIEVVELEMGSQPPELEIRDIGELTVDQFRGIFRLTYGGDAHIVLRTKVQANPLNHKQPDIHLMGGSRGMLAAKQPLVVPMLLRLSHFKLNSYVVLVVSKQKGITLVFKTDPLQNVDINSTFDSIAVIQKFIQREIEGQLRQMFREDLPGIIHRLSQHTTANFETASTPDLSYRGPRLSSLSLSPPHLRRPSYSVASHARTASSTHSVSSAGRRPLVSSAAPPPTPVETSASMQKAQRPFPISRILILRMACGRRDFQLKVCSAVSKYVLPEQGSRRFGRRTKRDGRQHGEGGSFDAGTWDDFLSDYDPPPSETEAETEAGTEVVTEYESVPAVGGGTITRPRIYHSQSLIQPTTRETPLSLPVRRPALSSHSGVRPSHVLRPSPMLSRPSLSLPVPSSLRAGSLYNPYFAGATPLYSGENSDFDAMTEPDWPDSVSERRRSMSTIPPVPPLDHTPPRRPGSPSSLQTQPSRSSDMTRSLPTPPASEGDSGININRARRLSNTSLNLDKFNSGSPPESHYMPPHDPKIILRPAANNSVSKLSTLSHSNHTLSPYTRTFEHYTVRSVPPREATSGPVSSVERPPVKARRKRIYRLGGKSANPPDITPPDAPPSPAPFSEFDASEMDRYFRSHDDLIPHYPDLPSSSPHIRRRFPFQPL